MPTWNWSAYLQEHIRETEVQEQQCTHGSKAFVLQDGGRQQLVAAACSMPNHLGRAASISFMPRVDGRKKAGSEFWCSEVENPDQTMRTQCLTLCDFANAGHYRF